MMVFLTFVVNTTKAQDFEGTLEYSMTAEGPQAEFMGQMLPKGFITYYKGGSFRTKTLQGDVKNEMLDSDVLYLNKGKDAYQIYEDSKTAVPLADTEPADADFLAMTKGQKLKPTNDYGIIAGYKARKYSLQITDPESGASVVQEVWTTDGLKVPNPSFNGFGDVYKELSGTIVQMTMEMKDILKMEIKLKKATKKPMDAGMFSLSGYKIKK